MTYKQFTDEIRGQIWAAFPGEGENLITVHDGFFIQALYDIQTHVPCARSNHRTRYDHCARYFECGMMVFPQPSKFVTGLFVVDRLDPDTGLENPLVDLQWCEKVWYQPVQYCHISRYVSLCQKSGTLLESLTDAFSNLLFGVYRRKRLYPAPTPLAELNAARVTAGQSALLALPEGFHYPDDSTDAQGRSPSGVFALHHGKVYIAPWPQSTETVVVLSNGVKTQFNPEDPIENNPKLKQAVRLHVTHQHESAYGDAAKARDAFEQLWSKEFGAMEALRVECLEQSRVHGCNEAAGGMAVGIAGLEAGNQFYNDQRFTHTASCPAGKTGSPVTVVKEVGTVPSALSVADANALASQQAAAEATAQLVCVDVPVTYYSAATKGRASCPGPKADGTPAAEGLDVVVDVLAGFRTSTGANASQAAADAAAQTAADALAAEQLVCTFWNKEQTATYHCPAGQVQTGEDGTSTVPAHTAPFSGPSQGYANQIAYNEALRLATLDFVENDGVCNTAPPVLVYNTTQTVGPISVPCQRIFNIPQGQQVCTFTVSVRATIVGGKESGGTLLEANNLAQARAWSYLNSVVSSPGFCYQFSQTPGNCVPSFDRVLFVP